MTRRLPSPHPLWPLRMLPQIQRDPLAALASTQKRYGNMVHLPLGRPGAVFVNEPEAVKQVLQGNHRNYTKATVQWAQMASIVGDGLLTSDGEQWRKQRRLMQPSFSRERLTSVADAVVLSAEHALGRWASQDKGGPLLDVDREMMALGLEVAGRALFSVDLRSRAQPFTEAVMHALDHMVFRSTHLFAPPDLVPTARNRRFARALATIDASARAMIRERRGMLTKPDDLLAMLLDARDADTGQAMTERELRDEVVTLLVAGHETVSSSLTWTLFLLAQHESVREQVEGELARVLEGRRPQLADVANLGLLQRVIDESLRLYPPAWLVTRKALQTDVLCGYPIRAGVTIVLSPFLLHRNPDFWPMPQRFDPDRFLDGERGQGRPAFAYAPFGGGPRLCIGDRFAKLELVLVLATLLQRVRLRVAPGQRVEPAPFATVRPRHGLRMQPTFRASRVGEREAEAR